MTLDTYSLPDHEGNPVTVYIQRDKRLKKSARWHKQQDGSLLIRIPSRLRKTELKVLLESITKQYIFFSETAWFLAYLMTADTSFVNFFNSRAPLSLPT